jgi:hypothetical protein
MPWGGPVRAGPQHRRRESECHADRVECRYAEFLRPQTAPSLWITCVQGEKPDVRTMGGASRVRTDAKRPKRKLRPSDNSISVAISDHLEMAGARLAALGDQLVADLLSLVEGRQTSALHGADMDEHVLRAVIGLDEAETLLRIEPFDFACRHIGNLSSCEQTGGRDRRLSPYSTALS